MPVAESEDLEDRVNTARLLRQDDRTFLVVPLWATDTPLFSKLEKEAKTKGVKTHRLITSILKEHLEQE